MNLLIDIPVQTAQYLTSSDDLARSLFRLSGRLPCMGRPENTLVTMPAVELYYNTTTNTG